MKKNQRSRTAEGAAALRASHTLHDAVPVFSDPIAIKLTTRRWARIVGQRWLNALVTRFVYRGLLPVKASIVVRSRYAEDALEAALARGVSQYVIVGAGLDSFALRRPQLSEQLKIFEVDHPASQASKKNRLQEAGFSLPGHVEFVAADFEHENLAQALQRSCYRPQDAAFFSWLGVTHYLTPAAALATLAAIAKSAARGSELVFDYSVPKELLSATQTRAAKKLSRYVTRRGEPFLGQWHPVDLSAECKKLGFEVVEDLSGAAQHQRYFAGRADGLTPMAGVHLIHLRLR